MRRILWERRPDPSKGFDRNQNIDEIVMADVKFFHIEQMSDRCWWIGIDLMGGGYWSGNISCDSRGRMRLTEQDPPDGFVWDQDDSHEELRRITP